MVPDKSAGTEGAHVVDKSEETEGCLSCTQTSQREQKKRVQKWNPEESEVTEGVYVVPRLRIV